MATEANRRAANGAARTCADRTLRRDRSVHTLPWMLAGCRISPMDSAADGLTHCIRAINNTLSAHFVLLPPETSLSTLQALCKILRIALLSRLPWLVVY